MVHVAQWWHWTRQMTIASQCQHLPLSSLSSGWSRRVQAVQGCRAVLLVHMDSPSLPRSFAVICPAVGNCCVTLLMGAVKSWLSSSLEGLVSSNRQQNTHLCSSCAGTNVSPHRATAPASRCWSKDCLKAASNLCRYHGQVQKSTFTHGFTLCHGEHFGQSPELLLFAISSTYNSGEEGGGKPC